MSKVLRIEALEDISTWPSLRVVDLLKKNGVDEACWKAVEKRKIDGDELLHLTEGKLTLWKSDLTKPLIRTLSTFVEELKKHPENYVEDKRKPPEPEPPSLAVIEPAIVTTQQQIETECDTGWDTDFEDSVDDKSDIGQPTAMDFQNNLKMFQGNDRSKVERPSKGSSPPVNVASPPASIDNNNAYANCEGTYANVGYAEDTPDQLNRLPTNVSKLHEQKKSLSEKLKEQLLLRGMSLELPLSATKPSVAPKPQGLVKRGREDVVLRRHEPRTSFLYRRINGTSTVEKKTGSAPPAETISPRKLSNNVNSVTLTDESILRNLPKPPVSIHGFDLVANLPTTRPTVDSDDEDEDDEDDDDDNDDDDDDDDDDEDYEAFDEQIVEQHQRNSLMSRTDSGQSLSSPDRNSIGSAYQPTSSISHDEEEGYEIYESITETPEENGRDYNKGQTNAKHPPPLPLKPPPNNTALHNQLNKLDSKAERSLEKKSATLPHSASNASLNNAARPLPPPPEHRNTYYERPWFHNLTREQANLLIEDQCTYHKAPDGCFLMRPSTTNPNNPLTLVLWCKDRVYNVPVRRRPDNRYSLGKAKPDEQSFASIDDIIPFYKKEELVLYTGGVQTSSTRLSETPPKEKLNTF